MRTLPDAAQFLAERPDPVLCEVSSWHSRNRVRPVRLPPVMPVEMPRDRGEIMTKAQDNLDRIMKKMYDSGITVTVERSPFSNDESPAAAIQDAAERLAMQHPARETEAK